MAVDWAHGSVLGAIRCRRGCGLAAVGSVVACALVCQGFGGWRALYAGAMRVGVYLPPFGELADPRVLAELAVEAEEVGFEGVSV